MKYLISWTLNALMSLCVRLGWEPLWLVDACEIHCIGHHRDEPTF